MWPDNGAVAANPFKFGSNATCHILMIRKHDNRNMAKTPLPDAEILAISALSFLATDPDRLSRFLAVTGLESGDLRRAAAGAGFLPAVLDYLLADEALLVAFAADQRLDPALIAETRRSMVAGRP